MEDLNMPVPTRYGDTDTIITTYNATMINATQMAKSFGKRPGDWLRLSSTKRFLAELSEVKKIPFGYLVEKVKEGSAGNKERGIWLQEDAALEFARWLSPAFTIWTNNRVKELLLTGQAVMQQQEGKDLLPAACRLLLNQVTQVEYEVHEQARIMDYHDNVLQSRTLIPTNIIAKELGMSAIALNKLLHDKKIIYKSNEHWVLYSEYQGRGYTGTKTALYIDSQGRYQSNIHTYWTEKGREFIHTLLKDAKRVA